MIHRTLTGRLQELAARFPALFLIGPRQSGKTTLARAAFPEFLYLSLEELDLRREATDDPRGFLRRLEGRGGIVIDEAQRAPDLFSYLQGFLDERRGGPVLLTGSHHFLLSEKIGQSLAGRTAVLELLPLSVAELCGREPLPPEVLQTCTEETGAARFSVPPRTGPRSPDLDDLMFRGLFPRLHQEEPDAVAWLDGYVRTFVERDARTLAGIGDLQAFTRFVGLCAGRIGSLLNLSSLGADAGVSHVTAGKWLSALRAAYLVDLLPPHHRNFSKRLIKSPKLYFTDTGVLCRLLGIRRREDLRTHPLRGAVFENFIVIEYRKLFLHRGERAPLFFWRDQGGTEVDLLVDFGEHCLPIEIKSGETVVPSFFAGLEAYARLSGRSGGLLVYGGDRFTGRGEFGVWPWWGCG